MPDGVERWGLRRLFRLNGIKSSRDVILGRRIISRDLIGYGISRISCFRLGDGLVRPFLFFLGGDITHGKACEGSVRFFADDDPEKACLQGRMNIAEIRPVRQLDDPLERAGVDFHMHDA